MSCGCGCVHIESNLQTPTSTTPCLRQVIEYMLQSNEADDEGVAVEVGDERSSARDGSPTRFGCVQIERAYYAGVPTTCAVHSFVCMRVQFA